MKYKIGKDLYLGGCIVTREGEPVYVHRSRDNGIEYSLLDNIGTSHYEVLNSSWDLSSPDIGMVNLDDGGSCVYLARKPIRAWRQGLTSQNIVTKLRRMPFKFTNENLKALRKCIKEEYPSFEEAAKASKESYHPVAFHKRFAIDVCKSRIYYKWHRIGDYVNGKVTLNSEFTHLEDALKEAMYENP